MGVLGRLIGAIIALILAIIMVILYFVPSYIAFKREHPQKWIILLLNLFLGETVIIWLIVLFWAIKGSRSEGDSIE